MKKNNVIKEAIFAAAIIILLVLDLNPSNFYMPDETIMSIVLGLLIAFIAFGIFVWRERAKDEREIFHQAHADRVAFLSGSTVLVIGIFIQSFASLDHWLVYALGVMVITKLFGLIYMKRRG